jgi:hypothetical protein
VDPQNARVADGSFEGEEAWTLKTKLKLSRSKLSPSESQFTMRHRTTRKRTPLSDLAEEALHVS